MIIVYPMFISENVSKDIVPGLVKSLEKYILIYNTDKLIQYVNNPTNKVLKIAAAAGTAAAISVASDFAYDKIKNGNLRRKGKKLIATEAKDKESWEGDKKKDFKSDIQKSLKNVSGGVNKITPAKFDQISIEPTWIQVETGSGIKVLGVKVVPYEIKTDSMIALLTNDSSLRTLPALSTKYSRVIMRLLSRAYQKIKLVVPSVGGSPVTGNAKNDIVWANTQYKKNIFICLSQLDVEQTDFKNNPQIMSKLSQLGWASMMFADDVNKQVTFCMKEFGGVCSSIPYTHIYAAFGKEHNKVYQDLEAAQKSTGPFFRKKSTTRRKIFS